MKILLSIILTLSVICGYGQWSSGNPVYFNDGNVGIGTSTPGVWFGCKTLEFSDWRPVFKLTSTSSDGLGTIVFTNTSVNGSNHIGEFHLNYQFNQTYNDKSLLRFNAYPASDIISLQASGNVGIGTSDPTNLFHIQSSGGGWLQNIRGQATQPGEFVGLKITSGYLNETAKWAGIAAVAVDQHSNNTGLSLYASASEKVRIDGTSGNVGIGTTDPKYPLSVKGIINSELNGDYYGAWFGGEARTDKPSINVGAWWNNKGSVYWNSNKMFFRTQINSTEFYEHNLVLDAGKVGIGTPNPDAKLAVKGTIHAEEVKVDLSVPGPDYVFEKDYNLMSLEETKAYIEKHKHLPEVPSAKEMETNGVNLSEMNMILLKKVEELTLHVIELKKESEAQTKRADLLENQIKKLTTQK